VAGGEWCIGRRARWDITDAFWDAAAETGIPPIADFNAGDNEGSGYVHVNQKRGRRWSASRGFLKPALKRDNIRLGTQCLVESVRFEGHRASGPTWNFMSSRFPWTSSAIACIRSGRLR